MRSEGIAMKDDKRRGAARKLAEGYAPRPISSLLMYGIVGSSAAGIGLVAVASFYDVDPLAHPLWVAAILLTVFVGSMVFRMIRSRRHAAAHRHEYRKTEPR